MIPTVSSLSGSNRNLNSNAKVAETPTAAERRTLADVAADMPVPTAADKGVATKGRMWLHAVVKNKDAGATFDVEFYGRHDMSEEWVLLDEATPGVEFETAGVWSIPAGLASRARTLQITGIERVYARIYNSAGLANGADVWLGSVGGFSPADR